MLSTRLETRRRFAGGLIPQGGEQFALAAVYTVTHGMRKYSVERMVGFLKATGAQVRLEASFGAPGVKTQPYRRASEWPVRFIIALVF